MKTSRISIEHFICQILFLTAVVAPMDQARSEVIRPSTMPNIGHESVYTSLEYGSEGCVKSENPSYLVNLVCKGLSGYSVNFVGSDGYTGLVFRSRSKEIDTLIPLINSGFGQVPNVTGQKLEWRYEKHSDGSKKLLGMIFRITAQDPETGRDISGLVAVNSNATESSSDEWFRVFPANGSENQDARLFLEAANRKQAALIPSL